MSTLSNFLTRKNLYSTFLHLAVFVLAFEVVILARQNRELKQNSTSPVGSIQTGDIFSFDGLEPLHIGASLEKSSKQLLFLFTTTCNFCKENLEMWRLIFEQAKTKDISIAGISLHPQDKTEAYIQENGLEYPVYFAHDGKKFEKTNRLRGVPSTIILDTTGKVENVWVGVLTESDILDILDAITLNNHSTINQNGGKL